MSNNIYTEAEGRITIDVAADGYIALSTLTSATWNIGCQYNNINMLDNRSKLCLLWGEATKCQLLAELRRAHFNFRLLCDAQQPINHISRIPIIYK